MSAEATDYLIVGAGAMGLAFADDLLAADRKATATIVDRRAKPGGHWTDAYPFVRLHQPAAFYGVGSEELGTGGEDLSSRSELLAYFERAVTRFLATGRVSFMPSTEYLGERRVRSVLDHDLVTEFDVKRKVVDATYMDVQVPATHPPRFEVDPSVEVVPPNDLVRLREPRRHYVVLGSGKTGGDAIVWLLDRGIDPGRIRWVSPNDMWIWNREVVQPRIAARELIDQIAIVEKAETIDEVFLELESRGSLWRLDRSLIPAKWRCATFDRRERDQLSRVADGVVRAGRVTRVTPDEIELEDGSIPLRGDTLVVNCTANGLASRPPVPIFSEDRITLQSIFECQQVFSAGVIGRLEAKDMSDEASNGVLTPVPHPQTKADFASTLVLSAENTLRLTREVPIWLARSRLNVFAHASKPRAGQALIRTWRLLPGAKASAQRMTAAS